MLRRILALAAVVGCAACASESPPPQPAAPPQAAAPADPTAYMAALATRPGVVVTPSGLAYRIDKAGPPGGGSPRIGDQVTVDYEGRLTDGTVFDASARNGGPASFTVGQLVAGWNEALQLMHPGDVWTLYVPPALGYGDEATGPIPPDSVLVFKLRLLAVTPAPAP